MKLACHKDADSLYIDLSEHPSVERREVSEGIVLDHDAEGNRVGIDIDTASRQVQLSEVELSGLHGEIRRRAGQRLLQLSARHASGFSPGVITEVQAPRAWLSRPPQVNQGGRRQPSHEANRP